MSCCRGGGLPHPLSLRCTAVRAVLFFFGCARQRPGAWECTMGDCTMGSAHS